MRRSWLLVVVCVLALGCQDAAKKDETKKDEVKKDEVKKEGAPTVGAVTATKKPARDPRGFLTEMARWLPGETVLFLFADLSALDPAELGMGLFTIPASFDPGPMTEELGAFLEKRIGINLMKIDWLAAAGSPEPEFFVLFLGGDFGALTGAEDVPGGLKVRALEGEDVFLATIPGARGLAVLPDRKSVETLSAVLQGTIPTLPGTPGMALLETLLERSGEPRSFVVAAQLTNETLRAQVFDALAGKLKGFVPPDGALIGAGEDILLLVHGQETSLEMIEGQLTLAKAMAKAMLDQALTGVDRAPVPQGMGLIVAKHLWPVVAEQLTPKRDGETLWIDLQIPGGLGMVSVVGVLAAVAIPAFIKYIQRSKTSEVHGNLQALYRAAGDYYLAERVAPDGSVVTCEMPPAMGPVPRGGTCCGALGDADPDGNDRCDGDEEEWNAAFGALKVPYPGSHYYTYEILPDPTSDTPAIILRATGDLDCDGERSTFERSLRGRPQPGGGCDFENSTALYVERETE